jgi:hypothetical protein
MVKANRRKKAALGGEVLALLSALARKNAYACLPDSTASSENTLPVLAGLDATPVAHARRAVVAQALREGLAEAGSCAERVRIAPAGLQALRAAKRKAATASRAMATDVTRGREPVQEGPLAWLRRRRDRFGDPYMSEAQISAAERLAEDHWRGGMSPRVTANWSVMAPRDRTPRTTPGIGVEISDAVLSARQRLFTALDVVGPELGFILVEICCNGRGLETIEAAAGWPSRTARVVFGLALTKLARHYGLLPPDRPVAAKFRHWGDDDFRPTLAG